MSLEVTNNSTSGVVVWHPTFEDNIIIDAAGATYAAGTVLGRITASGNLTKYASGAADGSEVPIAVLRDAVTLAAGVAQPCRPIVSGIVRRDDLIAHGVGALTQAEVDALRDYKIEAKSTLQLADLDNQ